MSNPSGHDHDAADRAGGASKARVEKASAEEQMTGVETGESGESGESGEFGEGGEAAVAVEGGEAAVSGEGGEAAVSGEGGEAAVSGQAAGFRENGDTEDPAGPAAVPDDHEAGTEVFGVGDSAPTEVLSMPSAARVDLVPTQRRFTAPSNFDAGSTEIMDSAQEPATEVFSAATEPNAIQAAKARAATPRAIPGRGRPALRRYRSWGWVLALILVIAALAAVAIMGTVLLTHKASPVLSQEDMVRLTIQDFDVAVQKGDLAALRSITCGATRANYVNYDDKAWADTHARVAAANQYPVVASIDQVIVDGNHAEANVTSFMADDPSTRSTRSFDLQYTEGQWKICQAAG